jgi:hypothetical protein
MLHTTELFTRAAEDPAPAFPTDADIEIAERLRRRLEERYLSGSATPSRSQTGSGEAR